jgi:L-rhamnose-H+ transport protein
MQSLALNSVSMPAGGLLIAAAGMVNAGFTLPLKRMRSWPWENAWLIWALTALVLFPLLAAELTIPNLSSVYMEVDKLTILRMCLYGVGWGIAQGMLGLAIESIGVALGFSIVLGVSAAMGTLIPFIRLHRAMLSTQTGGILLSGLALVVLGVGFCAAAGQGRELELANCPNRKTTSFKMGLAFAVLGGLLACSMNLGISFAGPLLNLAAQHGANPIWCANVIWPPLLAGGAIPNILYCLHLLRKHRSAAHYCANGVWFSWLLSVLMGVLWFGGHLFYGMGTSLLGILGPVIGWPAYMSLLVISASGYGFLTGEWRHVSARPIRLQLAGIAILCVAVFLFSQTHA